MINITKEAIDSAFNCLAERYQNWFADSKAMLDLYNSANRAFVGEGSLGDFRIVYEELRGKWQVFRGGQGHWSLEQTYRVLKDLPEDLKNCCLSELDTYKWRDVWNAIESLKDIKQLKEGPSLVAISKFLHFWNPRLFVIFDSEVVENWVFRHKYLADQLNSEHVKSVLDQLNLNNNSRLPKYFKALVFASDLISNYPHILEAFASKVHNDIGTYEATAVERFLLGLVELPPAGLEVSESKTEEKQNG